MENGYSKAVLVTTDWLAGHSATRRAASRS
jgi:hypothetical protein